MRFGWVIMLGVGLASGVAEGGENLVGGRWRSIGRTDETTTSTCLTNPKTPLCVVESDLACIIRKTREICRLGTPDGIDPESVYENAMTFMNVRVFYKVVFYSPPGKKAPKRRLDNFGGRWESPKPGDAVIGVLEMLCWPDDESAYCHLPGAEERTLPELDADDKINPINYYLLRQSSRVWGVAEYVYARLD